MTQGRGGKGIITFEFKEGKRVRPNGSRLVRAFHCTEAYTITVATSEGTLHTFVTEQAPIEDRKSIGKLIVPLEKKETITDIWRL
jgi:topoisomerase-4 subunit A